MVDLIDKHELLRALCAQVRADLETVAAAQRTTQSGATHEESRPENDKDTRALEASYLARGQAHRVVELNDALAQLERLELRAFAAGAPIALTALVTVGDDREESLYFLAPGGGGVRLSAGGRVVQVVTPSSPVGRALLGKVQGDDVDIRTPHGLREASIVRVD